MNADDINAALQPYGASLSPDGFISKGGKKLGVRPYQQGKRLRFETADGVLLASGPANAAMVKSFVEKFWMWRRA